MESAPIRSSRGEKKILKAYSDARGRTEKEALEYTKYEPGVRQHRRIRKKLQDFGLIEDLQRGVRGPVEHRWRTVRDFEQPATKGLKKSKVALDDRLLTIGMLIFRDLNEAEFKTRKTGFFLSRKRIIDLCLDIIEPVVKEIYNLRQEGFQLTLPSEYFGRSGSSKTIYRPDRLQGPIAVYPSNAKNEQKIFPMISEWHDYLRRVLFELAYILPPLEEDRILSKIDDYEKQELYEKFKKECSIEKPIIRSLE